MTTKSETESVLVDFQPMSPEEMQRTMQFLLQQQAQFAANLDSLSGKTDRLADGVIGPRPVDRSEELARAPSGLASPTPLEPAAAT